MSPVVRCLTYLCFQLVMHQVAIPLEVAGDCVDQVMCVCWGGGGGAWFMLHNFVNDMSSAVP